jgi:flagellar hook assembly protein FlgD
VTHPTDEQYLRPNYPNPFNPRTQIDFFVPQDAAVDVSVFNLLGQKVVCLLNKELSAGLHSVEWDGTDEYGHQAASGVYFYRMTTPTTSETRKMVLVK